MRSGNPETYSTVKKKPKTVFTCQSCGYQTPKWMGKCPDCNSWQTFAEESLKTGPAQSSRIGRISNVPEPVPIDSIDLAKEYRLLTGIKEFDRVLGGGLVSGSLVLIGGDPGIGKSTLMLQALYGLASQGRKVLYVSGEESIKQIKIRSERLSTVSGDLLVVSEIDLEAIISMVDKVCPDVLVIDSIQTMNQPCSL